MVPPPWGHLHFLLQKLPSSPIPIPIPKQVFCECCLLMLLTNSTEYNINFFSFCTRVTANLVSDEGYWKRCCKARWEVCDINQHGSSWKRMYFERNLEGRCFSKFAAHCYAQWQIQSQRKKSCTFFCLATTLLLSQCSPFQAVTSKIYHLQHTHYRLISGPEFLKIQLVKIKIHVHSLYQSGPCN